MAGQGVVQISWGNDKSPKRFGFYLNAILNGFYKIITRRGDRGRW